MSKLKNPFADPTKRHVLQGDFIGSKEWHRRATFEEQIIAYCLEKNFSAEDFIKHFNENIAPSLAKVYKNREEQKKKLREEWKEKRRISELPENYLPQIFLARKHAPQKLNETIQKYTLKDFRKVHQRAINGDFDSLLGISALPFIQWLNMVIQQKQAKPASTKQKILNTLRGH